MTTLPDGEFHERMARFQERIQAAGLDAALAHGNEYDFAPVRYLSDYWPTFEPAGVWVPAAGAPVLLTGPKSEGWARSRSRIGAIETLAVYGAPSEPEQPGVPVASFREVAARAMPGKPLRRLGLVGWPAMTMPIYTRLQCEFPGVELVKAEELLLDLRAVKSENEIALMRQAYAISEQAIDAVLGEMRPGMTELQVIGIAQREIYSRGAEYEAHALCCLCGPATRQPVARPSHNRIEHNEIVQLNIGARVGGYASSVGVPVSIGPLPKRKRRLVSFGLEAHHQAMQLLRAGRPAAEVAAEYEAWVKGRGFGEHLLYGPCHGIGMMEAEGPWMEARSAWMLRENMTLQVDTFFYGEDFGLRWENGVRIAATGIEHFSGKHMKLIEL